MRRSMSMALALTLPVTRPHRAPVWLRKATYRKTVQNLLWATGSSVIAMPPPAGGRPLETSAEEEQVWDSLHCIQAADARVLRQEDTRMLLEKTLATLASLVTQHLPLALGGGARARSAVLVLAVREGLYVRHLEGPYGLHLGGAEGGLPVLWQSVVWHHRGLSPPPRAGPRVPRKSLSVSDL
jgi:hypothetical protein